jgi:hypothetical protein
LNEPVSASFKNPTFGGSWNEKSQENISLPRRPGVTERFEDEALPGAWQEEIDEEGDAETDLERGAASIRTDGSKSRNESVHSFVTAASVRKGASVVSNELGNITNENDLTFSPSRKRKDLESTTNNEKPIFEIKSPNLQNFSLPLKFESRVFPSETVPLEFKEIENLDDIPSENMSMDELRKHNERLKWLIDQAEKEQVRLEKMRLGYKHQLETLLMSEQ